MDFFLKVIGGCVDFLPAGIYTKFARMPMIREVKLHDLNFKYFTNSRDALWGHSLANFTYFEPDTIRVFIQELYNQEKGIFLDIGSHSGLYGILAMKLGYQCSFFEANPKLKRNIERNIALNSKYPGQGTLSIVAVGDKANVIPLFLGSKKDSAVSTASNTHQDSRLKKRILVNQTTIDSLGLIPKIVKIDVEGYEEQVILGAAKTLSVCRPIVIMEALTRTSLERQSKLMSSFGYSSPQVCGEHSHDLRNFIWRPTRS
jgi:FkbM family methyltransferase